ARNAAGDVVGASRHASLDGRGRRAPRLPDEARAERLRLRLGEPPGRAPVEVSASQRAKYAFTRACGMTKLIVDGTEIDVPPAYTLLQACEAAGAEIPRFCFHERLSIAGNC